MDAELFIAHAGPRGSEYLAGFRREPREVRAGGDRSDFRRLLPLGAGTAGSLLGAAESFAAIIALEHHQSLVSA